MPIPLDKMEVSKSLNHISLFSDHRLVQIIARLTSVQIIVGTMTQIGYDGIENTPFVFVSLLLLWFQ